jgi:hypothetical protein
MTFLPPLLGLLTKERIEARVCYGVGVRAEPDRKPLARRLRGEVCQLKQEVGTWGGGPPLIHHRSKVERRTLADCADVLT